MSKKLQPLDKKINVPLSLTKKVIIAFTVRCKELKINRSNMIEELMITFLKDTK